MLYLTPNNYIPIKDIKFIINMQKNANFNKSLLKRIGESDFDINTSSDKKKRSFIIINNKKLIKCNINSSTLFERIQCNEVETLKFLDISYGNYIPINNILLIAEYNTEPIREIVLKLKENKSIKLFNFTSTRVTKTVIFTTTGEIILSAMESKTLYNKANDEKDIFQSIGFNNYINTEHIHMVANREENHIKLKVKAMENLDTKKILKVSKSEKAKTVLFCTNNFIVLSKVNPQTIKNNITKKIKTEIIDDEESIGDE